MAALLDPSCWRLGGTQPDLNFWSLSFSLISSHMRNFCSRGIPEGAEERSLREVETRWEGVLVSFSLQHVVWS